MSDKSLHPCAGCGVMIKGRNKKWCGPCSAKQMNKSRVQHLRRKKAEKESQAQEPKQ